MGLFDNIFLDDESLKAGNNISQVLDGPSEGSPGTEAGNSAQGTTTPEIQESNETPVDNTRLDTTGTIQTAPMEQTHIESVTDPANTVSNDVTFDIGGDIDFGFATPSPSDAQSPQLENPIPDELPVTSNVQNFAVNGISFDISGTAETSGTPDANSNAGTADTMQSSNSSGIIPESTENATPSIPSTGTTDVGSIAMIQGSTAASGISIIDTLNIEDTPASATESTTPASPSSSALSGETGEKTIIDAPISGLMDMITDVSAPVSIYTPQSNDDNNQSTIITDDVITTDNIPPHSEKGVAIDQSIPESLAGKSAEHYEEQGSVVQGIMEEDTHVASKIIESPIIYSETKSSSQLELTQILDGFIGELNEREMAISDIIIKRHALARRKVEFEEEYKTRLLALNMEDEFLRNKAERERSEQDKLQNVIKNFQKQIAINE